MKHDFYNKRLDQNKLHPLLEKSDEYYAMVKFKNKTHKVSLPFTVGQSNHNDLALNSNDSKAIEYVYFVEQGSLFQYSTTEHGFQRAEIFDHDDLKIFGLSRDSGKWDLTSWLSSLAQREQIWFKCLDLQRIQLKPLRRMTSLIKNQTLRYSGYLLLTLFCLTSILGIKNPFISKKGPHKYLPISLKIEPSKAHDIKWKQLAFDPNKPRAIDFVFHTTKNSDENYNVKLRANHLDIDKEITYLINNQALDHYDLNASCISAKFCDLQVSIPSKHLQQQNNILTIRQNTKDSLFTLSQITVEPIKKLTDLELSIAKRNIHSIQRHYDERHLNSKNLIYASKLLAQTKKILVNRENTKDMSVELNILSSDIQNSRNKTIDEIRFQINKAIKMTDLNSAIKHYEELLVFYETGQPEIKKMIQGKLAQLHRLNNI